MTNKTDKELDDAWEAAVDTFAAPEKKAKKKPESKTGTWVFCALEDKFVRKEDRMSPMEGTLLLKPMEPFISPVDGKAINTRAQLRAHNKEHGVTNAQDYGDAYFKRRGREMHNESIGNTPKAKAERREALNQKLYDHGIIR